MFYVYILQCSNDTLYTGYTTDVEERTATHNAGRGAKYTRGRTPVVLVYQEPHDTKSGAMRREVAIKKLSRRQKLRLIQNAQAEGRERPL